MLLLKPTITFNESNIFNMNICTYVSVINMQPKIYAISIDYNTLTYLNLNKSGDKKKSHSVRGDSYFVGAYLFSSPYSHLVWGLSEGTGFKCHT